MKIENELFTLETEALSYCFNARGEVVRFEDRRAGKNYCKPGSLFAYLLADDGKQTAPERVSAENGIMEVTFQNISFFILAVEFPGHIRFTVTDIKTGGAPSGKAYKFVFGAAETEAVTNDFTASSLSLHMKCTTAGYPGCGEKLGVVISGDMPGLNLSGALTADKRSMLPERVKDAMKHLTTDDFPVSTAGGPYAASFPGAFADYDIYTSGSLPDDVGAWLDDMLGRGIKQISFHQGGLFRHSDFVYKKDLFPDGVASFKEKVVGPMLERGMIPCLHSYAAMVDLKSRFVTPVPSPDLDAVKIYTLAKDMDAVTDAVPVTESTNEVCMIHNMELANTFYLMIDREIIGFKDISEFSFISCERGALGTKTAPHKKNVPVKHLCGAFGMFLSIPGSPLFIAQAIETAIAYNEGGYKAIYLDGLDFVSRAMRCGIYAKTFLKEPIWYYEALFVKEVLKHVNETPILEYSTMSENLWYARTRYIAWDYPMTGYKYFFKDHIENCRKLWMLTPEMGWFHLYPPAHEILKMPNWSVTCLYDDDLDYLGSISVIYNAGLSFQIGRDFEIRKKFPAMDRCEQHLNIYRKLRDDSYFPEAMRDELRESGMKYRAVKKGGEYGLQQFERLTVLPNFLSESAVKVTNPFNACRPFIRIEAKHAADTGGKATPVTIARFNKERELMNDTAVNFDQPLNLEGKEALALWVKGCGFGYLRLRMESGFSDEYVFKGYSYHIISLDFTGWRQIFLCEPNNGDFPEMTTDDGWHMYKNFREIIDYRKISEIMLTFLPDAATCAMPEGVCIGDIEAYPVSIEPVANPGVLFGGAEVTFDCALAPGSYIEYAPGDAEAVICDIFGVKKSCKAIGQTPELPAGESAVRLKGGAAGSRRLAAHLIAYGETYYK